MSYRLRMAGVQRYTTKVLGQRAVAEAAFELTFERPDLAFRTGQEITIHGSPEIGDRTYSLLNGEQDDALQILYRVVPHGALTPRLAALRTGDAISFSGPHGAFLLRDARRPAVFVATGTGIAPAVSFVRTHPRMDLSVLHGVRTAADLFYRDLFAQEQYVACISRARGGAWFPGRVTAFIAQEAPRQDADYYLCGSNEMILESRTLLTQKGCDPARIFCEPYFFW